VDPPHLSHAMVSRIPVGQAHGFRLRGIPPMMSRPDWGWSCQWLLLLEPSGRTVALKCRGQRTIGARRRRAWRHHVGHLWRRVPNRLGLSLMRVAILNLEEHDRTQRCATGTASSCAGSLRVVPRRQPFTESQARLFRDPGRANLRRAGPPDTSRHLKSSLEALRGRAGPPDTSRHLKSSLEALRGRAGPPDAHTHLKSSLEAPP